MSYFIMILTILSTSKIVRAEFADNLPNAGETAKTCEVTMTFSQNEVPEFVVVEDKNGIKHVEIRNQDPQKKFAQKR